MRCYQPESPAASPFENPLFRLRRKTRRGSRRSGLAGEAQGHSARRLGREMLTNGEYCGTSQPSLFIPLSEHLPPYNSLKKIKASHSTRYWKSEHRPTLVPNDTDICLRRNLASPHKIGHRIHFSCQIKYLSFGNVRNFFFFFNIFFIN